MPRRSYSLSCLGLTAGFARRSGADIRVQCDGFSQTDHRFLRSVGRDLGVKLAGVEIILNMRQKMETIQQQIEQFVETLNHELANRPRPEYPEDRNSRIPVGADHLHPPPRLKLAAQIEHSLQILW